MLTKAIFFLSIALLGAGGLAAQSAFAIQEAAYSAPLRQLVDALPQHVGWGH